MTANHLVAVAINETGKSKYIPLNYSVIYKADESDFEITAAGVVSSYSGEKTSFIVPDTINGITPVSVANNAFATSDIKVIQLPKTVKTLGKNAFNKCAKLTSITAEGVTKIGTFCFYSDTSLTNVDMPNVSVVNTSAFENCKKLETVNFNETVEELYRVHLRQQDSNMHIFQMFITFKTHLRIHRLYLPTYL